MSNELLDDLSKLDFLEEKLKEPISVGGLLRSTAFFFDFITIIVLGAIVGVFTIVLGFMIPEVISSLINKLLYLSLLLLYYPVLESSPLQASIGKFVVSIKVVDEKGERLSFARAFGRLLSTGIACVPLFIGIMMIGLTDKKGMNDMMSDTYVVMNNKTS